EHGWFGLDHGKSQSPNPKTHIPTTSPTNHERTENTRLDKVSPCAPCLRGRDHELGFRVWDFGVWDLSEEEPVGRVVGLDCVLVAESFEKRAEARKVAIFHFETGEHAAEVGPMISVVEKADVPTPRERVEEVSQRARTLGKLEAAQTFVLYVRCMAADHMADVQLGHLVVRQIDRFVAGAAELRDERVGILP